MPSQVGQSGRMDKWLIASDIHGCLRTLLALVEKHGKGRQLILLGDLVDRGPDSAGVVRYAMENGVPTCMGNHEDLLIAYSAHAKLGYKAKCTQYYDRDVWLYNGGDKTLESWGLHRGQPLPKNVLDWMSKLPPYLVIGTPNADGRKLFCSHTGFGLEADKNNWIQALWGRYPDEGDFPDDGAFRVFGHTRVRKSVVESTHVNLDTGCAYEGYGVLSALKWPECELVTQSNID